MKVDDPPLCQSSASEAPPTVATVAKRFADAVDREGRLPGESLDALRAGGYLSLLVPRAFGGAGLPLRSVANLCRSLSESCAATGLIFAMHHSQAAVLIEHGQESEWHQHLMQRIARDQCLVASATTEGATGGSIRRSQCFLDSQGDGVFLAKFGAVISYARAADLFLVSARRSEQAAASDQQLIVLQADQVELTPRSRWNPIGMRGACTDRFDLQARGTKDQIVPGTFAQAMSQTMLPTSHILLSSVWLGIASSALARAQAFLRSRNRSGAPMNPVANLRLAEGETLVQQMRALVSSSLSIYEGTAARGSASDLMVSYNALKVGASELVIRVTNLALRICGINGYMEEGEFYLSRHIRDAHAAMVMVNDDRILGSMSSVALGMSITRDV